MSYLCQKLSQKLIQQPVTVVCCLHRWRCLKTTFDRRRSLRFSANLFQLNPKTQNLKTVVEDSNKLKTDYQTKTIITETESDVRQPKKTAESIGYNVNKKSYLLRYISKLVVKTDSSSNPTESLHNSEHLMYG